MVCAALGLCYNSMSLWAFMSIDVAEMSLDIPYFYPAFYIMSAICIGCYLMLAGFGIQFLRGRVDHLRGFTILLISEFIYFFSIGTLWLLPGIGRSIGAATGVANGGLMVQFVILFNFWAPPLVFWARRNLMAPDTVGQPA